MQKLFLAGMLFLIGRLAWGEEPFVPGVVTVDRVNLRVGPSLRAELVGQVDQGQEVSVIASDGEWCAITPPPGLSAWIAADYLQDGVVTGNRVNVRNGPGIAFARLTQVNQGERLEVLGREGDWVKITIPAEVKLWLNARYVALSGTARSSPPTVFQSPVRTDREEVVAPAPTGREEAVLFLEPSPHPLVSRTPFLHRRAPAYVPAVSGEIRSHTGFIRRLSSPLSRGEITITHELVRSGPKPVVAAYLTSQTIDLKKYENRRVRFWAEEVARIEAPVPVWKVRGIQILW